jgi:hypothetical protein
MKILCLETQLRHILRLSVLVISSGINGIQIGEKSKLGWLIELPTYAMWADSLYFLSLLFLSNTRILVPSQSTLWFSSWACWANFDFSRSRSYIGETGRPQAVRLREHRHNFKEGLLEKSKLAQHAYEENHKVDWDRARILVFERNSGLRKYKDSAHMAYVGNSISQPSLDFSPIRIPLISDEITNTLRHKIWCNWVSKHSIFMNLVSLYWIWAEHFTLHFSHCPQMWASL